MIEHDILGIDRFDRILSIKQEIKKNTYYQGPAIELSAEFACSNHNDMVAEPPLQIEGNSAIFNWFGDHTIIHVSENKFLDENHISCGLFTIDPTTKYIKFTLRISQNTFVRRATCNFTRLTLKVRRYHNQKQIG